MEDYIDVLLKALDEHSQEHLGLEYFIQSKEAMQAMKNLAETLSSEQERLFRDYEEKQGKADAASGMALARQAFLLAREIYR